MDEKIVIDNKTVFNVSTALKTLPIYVISIPRLRMQHEIKEIIRKKKYTHWFSENCVQLSVLILFLDRTTWLP